MSHVCTKRGAVDTDQISVIRKESDHGRPNCHMILRGAVQVMVRIEEEEYDTIMAALKVPGPRIP